MAIKAVTAILRVAGNPPTDRQPQYAVCNSRIGHPWCPARQVARIELFQGRMFTKPAVVPAVNSTWQINDVPQP